VKEGEYGANTVHTCKNEKMRPVETIPGMGVGGKKNDGGDEFKYDIFDTCCVVMPHNKKKRKYNDIRKKSQTNKNATSFLLSLILSLQQNQKRRGWNRFSLKGEGCGGEVEQTMYTHVSKCKNDKIKGEKRKEKNKCSLWSHTEIWRIL
jgi:hypothetical protein